VVAGVSVDYYARLERGNLMGASESVLEAVARNARWDVVAANPLCRALYGGVLDDDRLPLNLARYVFLEPHSRGFFVDWDTVADDVAGALRVQAGRDPHDRFVSDLIGELSTRSEEFSTRWARQNVRLRLTAGEVAEIDARSAHLTVTGARGSGHESYR